MLKSLTMAILVLFATSSSALAQGSIGFTDLGTPATDTNATSGTAAQGDPGTINPKSSDVTVTENNTAPGAALGMTDPDWVQAPSNTTTAPVNDLNYQKTTANVTNVQQGLLAPAATMQYGYARNFAYTYDCGFGGPGPTTAIGMKYLGILTLPQVGTGTTNVDTIPYLGY